jgi:hypothetical protein
MSEYKGGNVRGFRSTYIDPGIIFWERVYFNILIFALVARNCP